MRLTVPRARWIVILAGLLALTAKVLIATNTYGTEDIHTWSGFALGVRQRGPVGVYGIDFPAVNGTLYNHPPLVGYYLALVNLLANWGVPLNLSLRGFSSAADVITALLVFEILLRRTPLRRAMLSAVGVAVSPALLLISGYHGNTDPVFVMLLLLGSHLIVDKRRPLSGGISLALAIGIKLVPVVAIPTLAVHLVRHRRDLLTRAVTAFGATLAITWGPAIIREASGLTHNVIGYQGISDRPWGLVHFADARGWSGATAFLVGPGSLLVVMVCALVPAAMAWRRCASCMPCLALSLVALLVLSPAFGVQYLAWPVAAAYLLDVYSATLYSVLGGAVLFEVYDHWNDGLPWTDIAFGRLFTPAEYAYAALLWGTLVVVLVRGTSKARSAGATQGEWLGRRPEPVSNDPRST